MAAQSPPEDPRLWHLSAAFDVSAHRPYFDDEAWGACFSGRVKGLPATVHTHLRVTPEGLLLHSACDRCSARDEVVLDFRDPDGPGEREPVPVDLASFGGERVREIQRALGEELFRTWAEAHHSCAPLASQLELPRPVSVTLGEVETFKAMELRDHGRTEPSIVVVVDAGALWFEMDAAGEARRMLTGFRVREATRTLGAPAQAVIATEEVVVQSASLLRFAVLMEGGNWLGEAVVDRFDRPYPGPGMLQPIDWSPIRETATWLDGLRARTRFHPLPRVLPGVSS